MIRKIAILLSLAVILSTIHVLAQSIEGGAPVVVTPSIIVPSGGGGGITGWCSLVPAQGNLTNCWPWDSTYTTTSTATDPVGGKNATLTSVTQLGSGPSTNLNNAGIFNGSSSTGATALANLPTTAFTLNIWLNTAQSGNQRPMANCHTDSDHNGFQMYMTNAGGGPSPLLDLGNGSTDTTVQSTGGTVNTWHMFTWTYASNTITVYTDGSLITTGSLTNPVTACANNIAFGFDPAFSGGFWSGSLAGAAIWNVALTSGQISTLAGL